MAELVYYLDDGWYSLTWIVPDSVVPMLLLNLSPEEAAMEMRIGLQIHRPPDTVVT